MSTTPPPPRFTIGQRVRFTLDTSVDIGVVVESGYNQYIDRRTKEPVDEYGWGYYVVYPDIGRVYTMEQFLEPVD